MSFLDSEHTKRRVVGIGVLLAAFLLLVVVATQPAAAWWIFGGDDWEPPENEGVTGLSQSEYISLWGRSSTLLEGVDSESEAEDRISSAYDNFATTESAQSTYAAFFLSGASTGSPRQVVEQWNRRNNRYAYYGEEPETPVRGSTTSSPPQIENAYLNLLKPSPHTIYDYRGSKTKFVGDRVSISTVGNAEYESRETIRSGNRITYFYLNDRRYNVTITATSEGEVLDRSQQSWRTSSASLDLSNASHQDEIQFRASGEYEYEEFRETVERVCVENETREYSWRGITWNQTICVDYNYPVISNSTSNHSVTVSDQVEYTKYEPKIDIHYATDRTERDRYYLNVDADAPIDGVDTGQEFLDFEMAYYAARDTRYDDTLGDIQPVNHYATPSESRFTIEDDFATDNTDRLAWSGASNSRPPGEDVKLQLHSTPRQITSAEVLGYADRGGRFSLSDLEARGIVRGQPAEINLTEADMDIEPTTLSAQFTPNGTDTYNQSVDIRVVNSSGYPIDTANNSNLHLTAVNDFAGVDRVVETNENGRANIVIPAKPGNVLEVAFHQEDFDTDGGTLYLPDQASTQLDSGINYSATVNLLGSGIFWLFFNRIGPAIFVLALINYGLTGSFLPAKLRKLLNFW